MTKHTITDIAKMVKIFKAPVENHLNEINTKTILFYSIPAPREDLQFMIPYRAVTPKPLCFTVFQLPERICSS